MRVLITGVDGFVGRNLVRYLLNERAKNKPNEDFEVIGTTRNLDSIDNKADLVQLQEKFTKHSQSPNRIQFSIIQLDLLQEYDWNFGKIDVIVHLAGIAHRDNKKNNNLESSKNIYFKVNYEASIALLKKALKQGLKQFIYLSTAKVFSNPDSKQNKVFTFESVTCPQDDYSVSKLKAERKIQSLMQKHQQQLENSKQLMGWTTIRAPLIYGRYVRANFAKLWGLVKHFSLLPTGSIQAKRSYLGVDNLSDLINFSLLNKKAFNQTLLPCDRELLSLNQMIEAMSQAQNKKIIQFKIPLILFRFIFKVIGKPDLTERLLCGFVIKSNCGKLQWQAPYSLATNLKKININQ